MLCTACESSLGEEILEEQEILMAERMVNTTTELNDRQKKNNGKGRFATRLR